MNSVVGILFGAVLLLTLWGFKLDREYERGIIFPPVNFSVMG